jgi:hypothetical protein
MRIITAVNIILTLILMAKMSYAECAEYTIVDHGDSVEAVCVGQPLTDAEKIEFEKQKALQNKADKKAELIRSIDECKKNNEIPKAKHKNCGALEFDLATSNMMDHVSSAPLNKSEHNLAVMQGQIAGQKAQFDAELAAQSQRQQAEMMRQQAEMQRMQQQQKFDQIWKK